MVSMALAFLAGMGGSPAVLAAAQERKERRRGRGEGSSEFCLELKIFRRYAGQLFSGVHQTCFLFLRRGLEN